jgi:cell division protein FtsZ
MSKTSYVPSSVRIKVIGMGGAGCNAVTRMVREQIQGIELIAMNTDAAHLEITEAPVRILLGEKLTRGLGAGGDPAVGKRAAEDTRDEIQRVLEGADMVFLAAGMGGGTGTGAISVVAEEAKRMGMLTVAALTKPFSFEGLRRMQVAEKNIAELLPKLDTLILVQNDGLLKVADKQTSINSAFYKADEILCQAVQAVAEVITVPGLVNLDFADVRAIIKDGGLAWMSIGRGSGSNRAVDAAREALTSPMLEGGVGGSKGVLFNVSGGHSLTLNEVNNAAKLIGEAVEPDANIIFGVNIDPNLGDELRLTLVATGIASPESRSTAQKEREITRVLKTLKSENDLAVPAYTRFKSAVPAR